MPAGTCPVGADLACPRDVVVGAVVCWAFHAAVSTAELTIEAVTARAVAAALKNFGTGAWDTALSVFDKFCAVKAGAKFRLLLLLADGVALQETQPLPGLCNVMRQCDILET